METQTDNLLEGVFWFIISKCDSGDLSCDPLEGIGLSAVEEMTLPASCLLSGTLTFPVLSLGHPEASQFE